jgi:hypothetical protein
MRCVADQEGVNASQGCVTPLVALAARIPQVSDGSLDTTDSRLVCFRQRNRGRGDDAAGEEFAALIRLDALHLLSI